MKKVFMFFLILLLSGCGSEDLSQFFYIYDQPVFPEKREDPLPYSLLVNDFAASSWLHNRQIAVIPSPNRIDYYDRYAWIAFPGELFAEQLYEMFKSSNLFSFVSRRASEGRFDYSVNGYINHLELLKQGDSLYAWFSLDISLEKLGSGPVVTKNIDRRFSLGEDPTVKDFAAEVFEQFNYHTILFIRECEEKIGKR